MINLSKDIEDAIKIIIVGLSYDIDVKEVDDNKLKLAMTSKTDSFKYAKELLNKWINSINRPSDDKIKKYVIELVEAGNLAIENLREALREPIDFEGLDASKYSSAIKAKPMILSSIFDIDSSLKELQSQIDSDSINLTDREFDVGYPEKYAKQEFFPLKDYYKKWYNKTKKAVVISPDSSCGEMITLDGLNIILPIPPKNKKDILFSNLPKSEQYWKREPLPVGLNPDSANSWHDYIIEEFRRRREGVWFMNNGKPVYLTGQFYFALQWGVMLDSGTCMDFRIAQLHMHYHVEACRIDKRCLGEIFLKSRRTGYTYEQIFGLLEESTSTCNGRYGMMSKSSDDVIEVFAKFSYALMNLPFFFRPVVRGNIDSLNKVEFSKPSDNSKESKKRKNTSTNDYLNTIIDWRPTKNDSYDSSKLNRYLGDEAAKVILPVSYVRHFSQIKPALMPSGTIVGKMFVGSTMGAAKKGGDDFRELYLASKVKDRDKILGRTDTALYSYFLPAHKNQEAFTDKYGFCWERKPNKPTLNSQGLPIETGSINYIEGLYAAAKRTSDSALNEAYRAEPMTEEHAFRDESNACLYNITKIYDQIKFNDSIPKHQLYTVGNLSWKDGVRDTEVIFNPNKDGKFYLSWMPDGSGGCKLNDVEKVGNKVYPNNGEYGRLASDPFSVRATTDGRGSNGAIHGRTMPNLTDIPSSKFFLEYIYRAKTEDIFFEDVVMACHFTGMPILVENNKVDLLRYMRNRGYRGFAINRVDKRTNKLSPHELEYGGQPMSGKNILADHSSAINSEVETHVGIADDDRNRPKGDLGDMPFNRTLIDWSKFDLDKRTKYDASISSGLVIMACNDNKYKPKKEVMKTTINFVKTFNNRGAISSVNNVKNS